MRYDGFTALSHTLNDQIEGRPLFYKILLPALFTIMEF